MHFPARGAIALNLLVREFEVDQALDAFDGRDFADDALGLTMLLVGWGWCAGGGDVWIPAHEVEGVPALALPFVHAAGDVVGAANFEHNGAG